MYATHRTEASTACRVFASEPQPRLNAAPSPSRTGLKRASRACYNCRLRKVKCDADITGGPCRNCRQDEVECVTAESRRSRKYRLKARQLRATEVPRTQHESSSLDRTRSRASVYLSPGRERLLADINPNPALPEHSLVAANGSLSAGADPSHIPVALPPGIRGARQDLDPHDYQHLVARGALSVPETTLQDELILAFVLYVHPYWPVLDLQDFLDAMYLQKNCAQCSLLLFQAVMFAGSAFVDMRLLGKAGFDSRRSARKALYDKVKLLYDCDWETDRITVIQSILLSNYWYLCPEDQKDTWHWLGICLSLSTSIGLNDSSQHLKLAPPVRRLWRRIWWVCILRDRVLATTTRKQLRIREEDISVPLLSLDDCETDPISTNVAARLGSTLLCDRTIRTTLARLFIEKVRLSLYAARVMVHTYTMTSHSMVTTDAVMLYSPRKDSLALSEAVKIHHDLEQWQSSRHGDCSFAPNLAEDVAETRVLYVHRAALRMFSLVVFATLYIPYLRTKINLPSLNPFLENTVRPYLASMGSEAAAMAELLLQHDLVKYLPPLSITYFLPASVRLIAELKCSSNETRGSLEYHLRQCRRVLLQLRETWHIADSACAIVEGLISRSGAMKVSDSTAAVFLEQDQPPGHQQHPLEQDEEAVLPHVVSTTHEECFSRQNGGAGNVVENFPLSTNVFDDVLWSELEPWFWSPTGNPQWMDFEVPGYDTAAFSNPHH